MQSNAAVKFAPVFTDDKKVEVSLHDDQAIIKLSTWSEDLGWCGQKTMSLDVEMLDDLHRILTAAKIKLNRSKAEEASERETSKILQFPSFS